MAQQLKKDIEVKMDADEDNRPNEEENDVQIVEEIARDDSENPFDITSLTREDLERLAEGYVENESEESVEMTVEEINEYVNKKIGEHTRELEMNDMNSVDEEPTEMPIVIKEEEREMPVLQKEVEKKSVGVFVDLPFLPESLPSLELFSKGEDLSGEKVILPSVKSSANADSDIEELPIIQKPQVAVEYIDLTDEDVTDMDTKASDGISSEGIPVSAPDVDSKNSTDVVPKTERDAPTSAPCDSSTETRVTKAERVVDVRTLTYVVSSTPVYGPYSLSTFPRSRSSYTARPRGKRARSSHRAKSRSSK